MKVYYLNMQGSLDAPKSAVLSSIVWVHNQIVELSASWLFFRELHDMLVNLINFGLLGLSSDSNAL